jgi:hypothetical protein
MIVRLRLEDRNVGPVRCPRPRVTLLVRSRFGDNAPIPFVLDTGADITAIPITVAESEGIAFRRTSEGAASGLLGRTTIFRDTIRVVIGGRPYDWPCNFVVTPPGGRDSLPVLGRAGFLDAFDFSIQDQFLTVIRRGSFPYWCRRVCSFVARPFVRRGHRDEAL